MERDQVLSIRSTVSLTLSNVTSRHWISITKIGVGDLMGTPIERIAYIKDVKSANTAGGDFVLGDWRKRDLNDLSGDTEFISINSSQFTLQPGKYEIEASAPCYLVGQHKIKLRNITDSTDDIIGQSDYAGTTASSSGSNGNLTGTITITSITIYEIQHQALTTRNTDGFGVQSNMGVSEIYTTVKVIKKS